MVMVFFVLDDVDSADALLCHICLPVSPQWAAADAEIKVPSGENIELKRSSF